MMKTHRVTGGGGINLHLLDAGNAKGRQILFIHGFSQCSLVWNRQLKSDLADDFRLVAMDLRGHGLSDRPREGYADSRLWADDVNATLQSLHLDHPILCGWSYGPLVILDYIRHYGEADISGIHFVGGITKLGSEEAMSNLTPEFLDLVPGFFSSELEVSVRSMESLVKLCFSHGLQAEDLYQMLGCNLSVPPHVRQTMLTRSIDNDDVLRKLQKPVLITHGTHDAVVRPSAVEQHKSSIKHAQIHLMKNAGHTPFSDDVPSFNRRLREFSEKL